MGIKQQCDCYRKSGKMIQWQDEATHPDIFDTVDKCKELGIKYRLTTIDDGKRLFVEKSRCEELLTIKNMQTPKQTQELKC